MSSEMIVSAPEQQQQQQQQHVQRQRLSSIAMLRLEAQSPPARADTPFGVPLMAWPLSELLAGQEVKARAWQGAAVHATATLRASPQLLASGTASSFPPTPRAANAHAGTRKRREMEAEEEDVEMREAAADDDERRVEDDTAGHEQGPCKRARA